MENQNNLQIKTENLTVPERLLNEVQTLITDYSNLVVSQETLPSIKIAFTTIKDKRVELDGVRKNGTSQFELYKKQFQTTIDGLTSKLIPLENKLKSDLNQFEDEDAWKTASKKCGYSDFQTYLNKFNNPKFDYKGKYVSQALAEIEKIENKRKAIEKNYTDFQAKCNALNAYKNSIDAKAGLERLRTYDVNIETFGENVGNAIAIKAAAVEVFENRIIELEAMELQAAEMAKQKEEQERQQAEIKAEREKMEKEQTDREAAAKAEQERIAKEKEENERKENERLAEIERREKELESLKELQRKQQEETDRRNALLAEGKIEINGKIYEISVINQLRAYYQSVSVNEVDYEEAISDMNKGIAEGKNFHTDLTTKQRENAARIDEVKEKLIAVMDNFKSFGVVKNAIETNLVTKHNIINWINENF